MSSPDMDDRRRVSGDLSDELNLKDRELARKESGTVKYKANC